MDDFCHVAEELYGDFEPNDGKEAESDYYSVVAQFYGPDTDNRLAASHNHSTQPNSRRTAPEKPDDA